MGELYFAYPEHAGFAGGPVIHLASSPDALHWKPCDRPGIRARRGSSSAMKVGGGTPPILTDAGWLARHRLLAPLAFPDRHVLLFVVAPLVGVVGPTFVAVGALELVMQARKGQLVWRKLTRGLSRQSGAA